MIENLTIIESRTQDNISQGFIDDIGQNTANCNKNYDRPVMKKLVQDESDNKAYHEMAQEQHIPLHREDEKLRIWLIARGSRTYLNEKCQAPVAVHRNFQDPGWFFVYREKKGKTG
jgi:hypothetical protein